MNILFVYSVQDAYSADRPLLNAEKIQFGISYISSLLRHYGHNSELIVLTRETKKRRIDQCIEIFNPKIICFTAVYTEYEFISMTAQYIKLNHPHIFLVAGGPHISLNPESCLADAFDALCIGEGEYPTLELVEQLENQKIPTKIPNLWIKHTEQIEKNSSRPFVQNIDDLPFPDREMWREWLVDPIINCSILLGRGCPFQCTYCCNHAFKKLSSGPYVRLRSPDNIVKEIKEIITNFPTIKEIYLEVESITINERFALELNSKLEHLNETLKHSLSYGVNLRVTPNFEFNDLFISFKKANYKYINIGIESGSEKIRFQILKRNYTNADIDRVVSLARKNDLKICFYNLLGIPCETISDFRETININRRYLPDWHFLSIFFPYPGTDLYDLCKQQGLIKEPLDKEMERSKAILNLPGFSKKQIQKYYVWFDYYVYKGYKPIYKIMARVFMSKIRTNYRMNHLFKMLTNNLFFKFLKKYLRKY